MGANALNSRAIPSGTLRAYRRMGFLLVVLASPSNLRLTEPFPSLSHFQWAESLEPARFNAPSGAGLVVAVTLAPSPFPTMGRN
jgi:hypothetical protein